MGVGIAVHPEVLSESPTRARGLRNSWQQVMLDTTRRFGTPRAATDTSRLFEPASTVPAATSDASRTTGGHTARRGTPSERPGWPRASSRPLTGQSGGLGAPAHRLHRPTRGRSRGPARNPGSGGVWASATDGAGLGQNAGWRRNRSTRERCRRTRPIPDRPAGLSLGQIFDRVWRVIPSWWVLPVRLLDDLQPAVFDLEISDLLLLTVRELDDGGGHTLTRFATAISGGGRLQRASPAGQPAHNRRPFRVTSGRPGNRDQPLSPATGRWTRTRTRTRSGHSSEPAVYSQSAGSSSWFATSTSSNGSISSNRGPCRTSWVRRSQSMNPRSSSFGRWT